MSRFRIGKVSLKEFRCFREASIDLSADVVAIYGRNGVGKTAIFDAVEFALFGSVERLAEDAPNDVEYISRVGSEGNTVVDLELISEDTATHVETTWDPSQHQLSIGGSKQWPHPRDLLYGLLVDKKRAPPKREVKTVSDLFHSSLMLSQYSIRAFVQPNSPEERAKILANLAGLSHVQRSKEKAEKVIALAERQKFKADKELSEVQSNLKELKGELAELEGREREIEEQLAGKRPTTKDVLEALDDAGMDKKLSIPTGESEALFARAIQSRCDERRTTLTRRNDQLSLLETGFQGYVDRHERITKLTESEKDLRKSLKDLADLYEKIVAGKETAASKLSKVEAEASRFSDDLKRWQRLSKLTSRMAELDKAFLSTDAAYKKEDSSFQSAQKSIEEKRRQREVLATNLKSARSSAKETRKKVVKLESIRGDFPGYVSASNELKDLARRLSESRKHLAALETQAALSNSKLSSLRTQVQEAETEAKKAESASEEQNTLLSRIRSLVSYPDCPLCGAEYESREDLLAAIDRMLASIPEATKSLMTRFQTLRSELTSAETDSKALTESRNGASEQITQLEKEQIRLQSITAKFEERTQESEIQPSKEDIADKTKQANQELQKLEREEQDALDKLERADDEIRSEDERLSEAQKSLDSRKEKHRRLRSELDKISVALSEAGFTKESSPDAETIGNTIDESAKGLAKVEKEKTIAASEMRKVELDERKNQRQREDARNRLNDLEKELGSLRASTKSYEADCKKFGVKPSPKALGTARKELDSQIQNLAEARKLAEKLELVGSLDALKTERAAVGKAADKTAAEEAELQSKLKGLLAAKQTAESWIPPLAKQLETVVENTLRRHQLEIARHFKAMIPSPHLFDQILLRHVDDRLEIGVQYRHQSSESGEPFFYLSNAQLNVLALSIFLSLGAKQQWSNLDSLLLDDPVQHLDDLDAVAFLDTIRAVALGRFGSRRQIILSTCDRNLYGLMIKKFRLLESAGLTFNAISLSERGLHGPKVSFDFSSSEQMASPLTA